MKTVSKRMKDSAKFAAMPAMSTLRWKKKNPDLTCLFHLSAAEVIALMQHIKDLRCHCGGKVNVEMGLDEDGKFNLSAKRSERDFVVCPKCGDASMHNLADVALTIYQG